jgi:mycothiol synthase
MVGIRPDLQGRGLGRVVTAAGLDHLVDVGATPIDITVDSANTPAVKLYESLGFTPEWRSFWYELSLD